MSSSTKSVSLVSAQSIIQIVQIVTKLAVYHAKLGLLWTSTQRPVRNAQTFITLIVQLATHNIARLVLVDSRCDPPPRTRPPTLPKPAVLITVISARKLNVSLAKTLLTMREYSVSRGDAASQTVLNAVAKDVTHAIKDILSKMVNVNVEVAASCMKTAPLAMQKGASHVPQAIP